MANAVNVPGEAQESGASQPRESNPRSRNTTNANSRRSDGRSGGRGQRGRGDRRTNRGRGNNSRGGLERSMKQQNANLSSASQHSGPPALVSDPVDDAKNKQNLDGEDPEAEVCFICASPVVHQSVAPCNHRTCHICALRLRALYKTRACAHCRTESPFIILTDDSAKRYEDFEDVDFQKVDDALGIKYEKQEIYDDTVLLLRYNCPEETCDIACYGWPDLHRHVRSVHHKMMCDLCTRHKKVFTHEHELFTQQELRRHEKYGDDNPGAIDQSGFKGHPECGFCRRRFYGDDELFVHCREKHERCHICDRRNSGRSQQYYVDYNALEAHFRKDHFLCPDAECLEKKFVVFDSEMDLKAHQLDTHPNSMSKDVRREARVVNLASFDYRTPHQEERRGRGGRGRGRDPNADISTMPLSRNEIAFQRQMAIQSAQSVSTRTFGGQLTASQTPQAPRPQQGRPNPLTVTNVSTSRQDQDNLSAPVENLRLGSRSPSPSQPSQSSQVSDPRTEARRLQHQGVMDRASSMLQNDIAKLNTFRTRVSAYQNSSITARELIESFFSLFDVASSELSTLIKELAHLYESESKRSELLKAWNDWRAINEDYPSLPGPSGSATAAAAAASAGSGGRRILRLKSSTAQSNRSAVGGGGQHVSWGGLPAFSASTANAAPPGWSNPFPSLPATSSGSGTLGTSSGGSWMKPTKTPLAPATVGVQATTSLSAAPRRAVPTSSSEAFPELPKAPKPNTLIFGKHHGAVRWNDSPGSGPPANAWNTTGKEAASGESGTDTAAQEPPGGKKKGKKGKEVLYKFG